MQRLARLLPGRGVQEAEVCPKCPACREDYDLHTRLPLLLPCYHVICSACVAGQGGRVTCPTCSKVKVLSKSEELPRDVCTVNEVTLAKLPSLPCGQCEVEGHVTHRCTMCRSLLCQDCVTQHARMKVFRKHRPLPLSSRLELRQEFFQEVELCPDGNSPSGFCWECSSAVCSDCKDDHQRSGHDYVTLAHAQDEAHEEHGQLLQELDSRRGELETFRKSAVAMDAKNQEVAENCGNQLLELRNQLLQAVHARVGQLQTQLRQAARVQTSRHENNMAALDQSEAEVEATRGYMTRLTQWSQPAQFLAQHRTQTSSVRQLLASPVCPSEVDLQPRQVKLDNVGLQRVLDLLTSVGDVLESFEHVKTEPEEAEAEAEEVFCDGSCPGVPHCSQEHASPLQESSRTAWKILPKPAETKAPRDDLEEGLEVDGLTESGETNEKLPPLRDFAKSVEASGSSSDGSMTSSTRFAASGEVISSSASPQPFKRQSSLRKAVSNMVSTLTDKEDKESNFISSFRSDYGADVSHAMPARPAQVLTELRFCTDCLNPDDFSVKDGVLVNRSGGRRSQEDEPHPHRPCPSPWNLQTRAPLCDRLNRYWGTLGNVILGSGCFSWRVKIRLWTERQSWQESSYLFEMGVIRPGLGNLGTQALGG